MTVREFIRSELARLLHRTSENSQLKNHAEIRKLQWKLSGLEIYLTNILIIGVVLMILGSIVWFIIHKAS